MPCSHPSRAQTQRRLAHPSLCLASWCGLSAHAQQACIGSAPVLWPKLQTSARVCRFLAMWQPREIVHRLASVLLRSRPRQCREGPGRNEDLVERGRPTSGWVSEQGWAIILQPGCGLRPRRFEEKLAKATAAEEKVLLSQEQRRKEANNEAGGKTRDKIQALMELNGKRARATSSQEKELIQAHRSLGPVCHGSGETGRRTWT